MLEFNRPEPEGEGGFQHKYMHGYRALTILYPT